MQVIILIFPSHHHRTLVPLEVPTNAPTLTES